jgi:hypothetical protein
LPAHRKISSCQLADAVPLDRCHAQKSAIKGLGSGLPACTHLATVSAVGSSPSGSCSGILGRIRVLEGACCALALSRSEGAEEGTGTGTGFVFAWASVEAPVEALA